MNTEKVDQAVKDEMEFLQYFVSQLFVTVDNEQRQLLTLELSEYSMKHQVKIPGGHGGIETVDDVRPMIREELKSHYVLLLTKACEYEIRLTGSFVGWLVAQRVWEWVWDSLHPTLKQYLDEQFVSTGYRAASRLWLERQNEVQT